MIARRKSTDMFKDWQDGINTDYALKPEYNNGILQPGRKISDFGNFGLPLRPEPTI